MVYLVIILITIGLLLATVLVHYSILRQLTNVVKQRTSKPSLVIAIVMVLFLTHTIEIFMYAIFYYIAEYFPALGYISGVDSGDFFSATYLSLLSYSSLGFSDLHPVGGLRLLAGFEALNGLLLITWSASFTFLAMGRLWDCNICASNNNSIDSRKIDTDNIVAPR